MLQGLNQPVFRTGWILGCLGFASAASAQDPGFAAQRAWSLGQPVQVFGTAPLNRMPGDAPPIQLLNDPESGGDIWFLIDGEERSLRPGETLDLNNDRTHTVDFNTGGPLGDQKFSLYQGVYKFKVTSQGWALVKSSSAPVASRSVSPAASATREGGFAPPLPAEDLRKRRVVRADAAQESARPIPAPPAAGSTRTDSGGPPAPPAPGVTRPRAEAIQP